MFGLIKIISQNKLIVLFLMWLFFKNAQNPAVQNLIARFKQNKKGALLALLALFLQQTPFGTKLLGRMPFLKTILAAKLTQFSYRELEALWNQLKKV